MENAQTNILMKMENILKNSWNFSTAFHESRTRSSEHSMFICTAVIWQPEAFGLCSGFQIIMLCRGQTIFLTLYFQFEKRFDFLFVCM